MADPQRDTHTTQEYNHMKCLQTPWGFVGAVIFQARPTSITYMTTYLI